MSDSANTVYYYANWPEAVAVFTAGAILPKSIADATTPRWAAHRPFVLCSRQPLWEPFANTVTVDDEGVVNVAKFADTRDGFGPLVRFVLPAKLAPLRFADMGPKMHAHPLLVEAFTTMADACGCITERWRFSLRPIPCRQWRAVELLRGDRWEP